MSHSEANKRHASTAPSPKETLIATFQYRRRQQGGPDEEIDLRNEVVGRQLAEALFEDSYNYFEMFLDDSGVNDEDKCRLKQMVFDTLVREKTLGDMPALTHVIAKVLERFYAPVGLIEIVKAMEITYQKQVIEQYPPGIPMAVPQIDKVDKLPQLILGILKAGDLY